MSAASASASASSSSILDLWLLAFLGLLGLGFVVRHLLLTFLLHEQLDGVADKLGVLLDNLLDLLFLDVLSLVLLHVEHDLGSAAERLAVVGADGEGAAGARLPDVLLVVVPM